MFRPISAPARRPYILLGVLSGILVLVPLAFGVRGFGQDNGGAAKPGQVDDTGIIPRVKNLELKVAKLEKELGSLQQDFEAFKRNTNAELRKVVKSQSADVTTLSNRIAALERHYGNSQDHAFINAGLNNAGGKSHSLIVTPDGHLVLRHNDPKDPKGWSGQVLIK
jgi:hypothetical protein